MDRTSIIALLVCFVVLLLWYPLVVNKLYPTKPTPATTHVPPGTVLSTNVPLTSSVPATAEAPAAPQVSLVRTNVAEELLEVENEKARYTFSTHGGGLKLVELKDYPETVATRREKGPQTKRLATLNKFSRVPTLALLGGEAVQGDGIFALTQTGNVVRAEKQLPTGLRIVKEFELSTNYLVVGKVRLENASEQPLQLPAQEWVVGTATPLGPRDKGETVGVMWYNGSKSQDVGEPWFANRTLGCLPGTPRSEFKDGASNVVWAAAHNRFFTLAAMPQEPGHSVVVRKFDLPKPTGEDAAMVAKDALPPQGYETVLTYSGSVLAPKQAVEHVVYFFAGPKEYRTLARIANRFNNNVDLAMGFNPPFGGRFVGFFAKLLLLCMNGLQDLFKVGYGWVIIIITVIIKLLFWPLTQASTRSMKRMQALQPQMTALREKYKEDPVKLNRKMMEFWKENKVSPMGGCLPMLLQMPVFIGFYVMIQSAIELRGSRFLWVADLTQSDTLFVIAGLGFIPFFGIPGIGLPFNLLPLMMGATMLWQAHLTPASPSMDPMQQKIMKYMPLMFMVFLYNFSAGLTLYWTVQNLLTIAQTKLTPVAPPAPPPAPAKGPVLTAHPKKRK